MKVLTIRQPWAGLVARGIKDVENRTWLPHGRDLIIGQRFAIHAGRVDDLARRRQVPDGHNHLEHKLCNMHGLIIATVVLADVTDDSTSVWAVDGAWHWVLTRPRLVRDPVATRGQPGLWDWTP